jgi:peptide/nickel transport system permease protein
MIEYTIRRVFFGVIVLMMVTVFVFVVMRMVPGDAISLQIQAASGVTEEQVEALRGQFGLDQPVHVQFWEWIQGAVRGDFGRSFWTGEPVLDMFLRRAPVTLLLGAVSLTFGIIVGLAMGIISAMRRGSGTDNTLRVTAVAGLSVPDYVVGLLLLTFGAIWFNWSPPFVYRSPFDDFGSWAQHIFMPAFALGAGAMAGIARLTRSSMLEAMGSQFIRTVRAKGVSERQVVLKHAWRNSMIAVLTLVGVQLGTILGGTVILEAMFSIPGTGQMIFNGVIDRDYPVVVASTIFYAGLFVTVIIITDLLYAAIDPRIREGGGRQ